MPSDPTPALTTLRSERAALEASIRADERFLDAVLERQPTAHAQESADLRERIAEGRMIRDRLDRLIRRIESTYPWLGDEE